MFRPHGPKATLPAYFMPVYRHMDINLQLEGRGHPPLSAVEEYALLMHDQWSVLTCADKVIQRRQLDASMGA